MSSSPGGRTNFEDESLTVQQRAKKEQAIYVLLSTGGTMEPYRIKALFKVLDEGKPLLMERASELQFCWKLACCCCNTITGNKIQGGEFVEVSLGIVQIHCQEDVLDVLCYYSVQITTVYDGCYWCLCHVFRFMFMLPGLYVHTQESICFVTFD
ncbi:hypothetical protein MKX03_002981 [Papaver bracteatum]|nr:hypothetical protein MKX03_002981 [Papaver bracteatum]